MTILLITPLNGKRMNLGAIVPKTGLGALTLSGLALTGGGVWGADGQAVSDQRLNITSSTAFHDALANAKFTNGYPTSDSAAMLTDELYFERAVQIYLWALPAANMFAMKEISEKTYGAGYNVLPVWKQRLNARTKVTTPNSDCP